MTVFSDNVFFSFIFFLNGTFSKQKTNLIMDDYASSLFFELNAVI